MFAIFTKLLTNLASLISPVFYKLLYTSHTALVTGAVIIMKKLIVLFLAIVAIFYLAACAKIENNTTPSISTESITESVPETTLGIGEADKISRGINVPLVRCDNWEKIVDAPIMSYDEMRSLDGSTATVHITAELYRQFYDVTDEELEESQKNNQDGLTGIFYHSTTHNAYVNLIETLNPEFYGKTTSLIFVTPPSEEEKQLAKDNNIELDITPIAKDGFVFITHNDNPVNSLTTEQIQDIYTGKIKNWNQVGGNNLEIKAYQREANSGSQTTMEQLVMQGNPMIPSINTMAYSMSGLIEAVAEYENGTASIGYTYNYYINNLYKNDNIKVLNVNGITPADKNLISEVYPFTTSYYAVMRSNEPKDSNATKLRDFLVTPKGQDVIAMAGYCKAIK